jgi:hypothetical protein
MASDTLNLTLPSTNTFSYDYNGNLTNDGLRVFEYDFENQLTNWPCLDSVGVSYVNV